MMLILLLASFFFFAGRRVGFIASGSEESVIYSLTSISWIESISLDERWNHGHFPIDHLSLRLIGARI